MEQKKPRKTWLYILLTVVVFIAVVSAFVIAKYIKSAEMPNNFAPAKVIDPTVIEKFDGELKENVKFNVGEIDYPVYVRAEIVITWQKKDDTGYTVYFTKPNQATPIYEEEQIAGYEGDYIIDLNLTDWELRSDGFYYYKYPVYPVKGGGETTNLINMCKQVSPAPAEGYTLSVEIIVQTVQAIGYTDGENEEDTNVSEAWEDAWLQPTTQPSQP